MLLGINFLVKPLYLFGVDQHIQNIVGTSSYGMYVVVFNLAFLLQFIHEPGIQSFNSQNIAKNPQSLVYHLPRILGVKSMLLIIYALALMVAFLLKGLSDEYAHLMLIVGINLFLSTLFIYLRSNLSSIGKYRQDSLISSLDKLLMLIILGIASWVEPFQSQFNILWLAYGQMIAFLISCIIALWLLYRQVKTISILWDKTYFIQLLRWSYPYALILLSMTAYTKMDAIMIEHILDDGGYETGIYAAAFRFFDAANMVGYLFAALLLPMYASHIKDKAVLNDLLQTGMKLMAVISFIAAGTLMAFGYEVLNLGLRGVTAYYESVLIYLMLSFVMISTAYLFGTLLVSAQKLKKVNILYGLGVLLNFSINIYLIPRYKALGAAQATFITQTIMTVGQIYLVYQVMNIRISLRLWLNIGIFAFLCVVIFYSIQHIHWMPWYTSALIGILLSSAGAFITGLLDINSLLKLVNKR